MTILLTPPDVVDDVRRREFLGILAAAGLLAGCGGAESPASPSPGGDAAYPRTIDHAGGSTTLERAPRKIMALAGHGGLLDDLLALGRADFELLSPFLEDAPPTQRVLDALAERGAELGDADYPPKAEAILAEQPDLIFVSTFSQEFVEEQVGAEVLERLPTIVYDGDDARARLDLLASIFAAEDRVASVLAEQTEILGAVEVPEGLEISVFSAYDEGGVMVEVKYDGSPQGDLFEDLGFEVRRVEPVIDEGYTVVAEENFGLLEAEVMVNMTAFGPSELLDDSAVFQSIDAVREGHFVSLSYDESFAVSYPSPFTASLLASAIERIVATA